MASGRSRRYGLVAAELGAVSAQTVMVALLPLLLQHLGASTLVIGVVVGGEGAFALAVPFFSGAASDRMPGRIAARFGRRMAVAGPAAALLAAAVASTPFLSSVASIAIAAFVAFAALHAFLTPFWSLLVEDVPADRRGRVQGIRGMYRAAGLAYGLVAGGLLFAAWQPLPFFVAAALVLGTTAITWLARRRRGDEQERRRASLAESWRQTARTPGAVWLLAADACWNASVDGIRPYFFLYARNTLGLGLSATPLGLGVLVAVLGAASWLVGRLADRHDAHRILVLSSAVLAGAFASGFFVRGAVAAIAVAAAAGTGAAAIQTLPLPLYQSMLGQHASGETTGIFEISVTVGRIVSPLLVGEAIDLAAKWGVGAHGYPAMWLVAASLGAAGGWCAHRSRHARTRARTDRPGVRRAAMSHERR